jgi:hypothetical protein
MNTAQTQIRQGSESGNRIRRSNPKDFCKNRNSLLKWFPLMMEDRSIEAMNKRKMQTRENSQFCSQDQKSLSTKSGTERNRRWTAFQLMKECELIRAMNTA